MTVLFLWFDRSFLKIILKITFYRHLQDKVYLLCSIFKRKIATQSTFLGILIFPFLTSNSWYLSYAKYFINVFHSENVALNTLTSIDNIQKSVKIQLKSQKQDGSCQKIWSSIEEEIKMIRKNAWGKRKPLQKNRKTKTSELLLIKCIKITKLFLIESNFNFF